MEVSALMKTKDPLLGQIPQASQSRSCFRFRYAALVLQEVVEAVQNAEQKKSVSAFKRKSHP